MHKLAWDTFIAGTAVAREQGLYGAGQDLLKDAFSGHVRGMGPAVAEMEIEERPNEPFLFFAADKTDPGAFNLPLYLAFADPMNTPGLILSPKMTQGFRFTIMDVNHTEGDRVIELDAPEDLHAIAALLRDPERYVVESVVAQDTGTSYFDGPPLVSCAAYALHDGKFTEAVDCFAHPFWNEVRSRVSAKAMDMRRQGFFGAAMLPMSELEYTGIVESLDALEGRFRVREAQAEPAAA